MSTLDSFKDATLSGSNETSSDLITKAGINKIVLIIVPIILAIAFVFGALCYLYFYMKNNNGNSKKDQDNIPSKSKSIAPDAFSKESSSKLKENVPKSNNKSSSAISFKSLWPKSRCLDDDRETTVTRLHLREQAASSTTRSKGLKDLSETVSHAKNAKSLEPKEKASLPLIVHGSDSRTSLNLSSVSGSVISIASVNKSICP